MPQKKITINDLPTELIEQICAWLVHPYHDAILDMRLASKTLAAKSSRFFGKMFFERSQFTLANLKHNYPLLREIQKSHFADFIQEIQLSAGDISIPGVPHGMTYQNYYRAKRVDPGAFAKAMSELPNLQVVIFGGFRSLCHGVSNNLLREIGPPFMEMMAQNLYIPKLRAFYFERLEIKKNDLVNLIKKHRKTLHSIAFESVLLSNGTWQTIIRALQHVKNLGHVNIGTPTERHPTRIFEVSFTPPDYFPPDFDDTWSDMDSEFDPEDMFQDQLEEMTFRDEWADWEIMEWADPHTFDHPKSWSCNIHERVPDFLDDMRERYHREYF